jgi:hypothetical protein
MTEILASPLYTDADARILMRLALHQNVDTGRLFVSAQRLALGANQSRRQSKLTITKAVRLGSITRTVRGGRGKANAYNLKSGNGDSPFSKKGESPCTETHPKGGIGIPPNREESTGDLADRSQRPSMADLRAKYPDLLKAKD